MTTVHIGVSSREEFNNRAKAAFRGEHQGEHIGFASFELMYRTLTPGRTAMLEAMMGQGPVGIDELARRLDRNVEATDADATALVNSGVIDRVEGGLVEFPYDDFEIVYSPKAARAANEAA